MDRMTPEQSKLLQDLSEQHRAFVIRQHQLAPPVTSEQLAFTAKAIQRSRERRRLQQAVASIREAAVRIGVEPAELLDDELS